MKKKESKKSFQVTFVTPTRMASIHDLSDHDYG